jgi:hypothetical protein
VGFNDEDKFCSLEEAEYMNHAMTPPVAADETGNSWVAVETFCSGNADNKRTHGCCAAVEYKFNSETSLYEWTRTGKLISLPDMVMGETSISCFDDQWIIALRTWSKGGVTVWFKTPDPFNDVGKPYFHETTWGPRHSYRCADGVLRIFQNDQKLSPYGEKRNPLYSFDVDINDFTYSEPVTLFDARKDLPFDPGFCDMSKLGPVVGNKQLLFFRAIDHCMTTEEKIEDKENWQKRMDAAGVHAVELEYDKVVDEGWEF